MPELLERKDELAAGKPVEKVRLETLMVAYSVDAEFTPIHFIGPKVGYMVVGQYREHCCLQSPDCQGEG